MSSYVVYTVDLAIHQSIDLYVHSKELAMTTVNIIRYSNRSVRPVNTVRNTDAPLADLSLHSETMSISTTP